MKQTQHTHEPSGEPLDADARAFVVAVVDEHGEVHAAQLLGVSRQSVLRAYAGLGLYPLTRRRIRDAMARDDRAA